MSKSFLDSRFNRTNRHLFHVLIMENISSCQFFALKERVKLVMIRRNLSIDIHKFSFYNDLILFNEVYCIVKAFFTE
jgi:hypothetical protein